MRAKDKRAIELSLSLRGAEPMDIIMAASKEFSPVAIFVGCTGGFDSTTAAHFCMTHIPDCKVFLANTNFGVPEAWEHVRETCAENGWPLVEINAKDDCGQDYEQMVIERGFPGPGHHYKMFQRLKERPVRELLRRCKTKRSDNIMLITGIRQDESQRRSNYGYSVMDFAGNVLWVNPFYYKSADWFAEYAETHGLERSCVSKNLGMSGECLCGAYAHKGEKALIRTFYPDTAARIDALEEKVKAAGHDWGWEDKPPRSRADKRQYFMPFCVGCEKTDNLQGAE